MKITFFILLAGVLTLSVAEAGDNSMKERAQALMSELKVKPASDHELPARGQGVLSAQKFKTTGNLIVRHKTEGGGDGHITSDKLLFLDGKGKIKAVGKVKHAKSPKAAQDALFEELAMNSLPLELLLKRYEVKKDGPGDICVVEKIFDKATSRFVVDESQVHFVRGNIAVSVRSEDAGVKAKELARQMDKAFSAVEEKPAGRAE